ncbi:MAG: TolC family protein [Planctomycetes bacterium]|nr:TolC family protein [Planctomycetota bacterium]
MGPKRERGTRRPWRAGYLRGRVALLMFACLAGPVGCQSAHRLCGRAPPVPTAEESVGPGSGGPSEQGGPQEDAADAGGSPDAVTVVKIGAPRHPGDRASAPPLPAATPVLPPTSEEWVDLGTALAVAGVENPTIGRAVEAVRAAQAALLRARALLLPTLNAGSSFDLHRGNLLSARGIVRDLHRESVYAGSGASAVGAGTVTIPGVRLFAHLADAVFEPGVARREVEGRRFDSEATRNAILLDVAVRYLALAGAEARLQAIRRSERDLAEVVRLTANFARIGQGRKGDADRALSEGLLLRAEEQRAEGEVAEASANLARLLNLDPSTRLRAAEEAVPLLQLVDPGVPLERLLEVARNNRPEVRARSADVAAAETRLRQERVRPFVPVLSVGYSAGGFGGGSNQVAPRFGNFDPRTDLDVFAYWSLANLGLGNLAVQRECRAEVGQAEAKRARALNAINREVADAYAVVAARRREVDVALRRVRTMGEGFRLDLTRATNLVNRARPIEVLNSLNLLRAAREDLARAVVGYDQAQFQLFVSLGQPPPPAPGQTAMPSEVPFGGGCWAKSSR